MIGTEVAVFAALFGAGLGAGLLAAFLLALGRGSRIARAVCDLVTPPVVGVLFFLTLRAVASGVFRLYSAVAFLLGGALAILLARRSAPLLSRVLNRVKVPIKSLENRISRRLARLFVPIAQRRAARKKKRVERRAADATGSGSTSECELSYDRGTMPRSEQMMQTKRDYESSNSARAEKAAETSAP